MAVAFLPQFVRENYEILEWNHATAILRDDFPQEWQNVLDLLTNFRLRRTHLTVGGGSKSLVAQSLDSALYNQGWVEKQFDTRQQVDGAERITPTHKIDCFKNKIGVEIEWNNKDPFFDRDLNNFRLLFELKTISVGIIITRSSELQTLFNELGRRESFGQSTTHFNKLVPRILGAGSGGCPVIAFGIKRSLYIDDSVVIPTV